VSYYRPTVRVTALYAPIQISETVINYIGLQRLRVIYEYSFNSNVGLERLQAVNADAVERNKRRGRLYDDLGEVGRGLDLGVVEWTAG